MTAADLGVLIDRVVADRALHRRLLDEIDRQRFTDAVVELAGELRLDVTAADVELALRDAHEWWLMRWV